MAAVPSGAPAAKKPSPSASAPRVSSLSAKRRKESDSDCASENESASGDLQLPASKYHVSCFAYVSVDSCGFELSMLCFQMARKSSGKKRPKEQLKSSLSNASNNPSPEDGHKPASQNYHPIADRKSPTPDEVPLFFGEDDDSPRELSGPARIKPSKRSISNASTDEDDGPVKRIVRKRPRPDYSAFYEPLPELASAHLEEKLRRQPYTARRSRSASSEAEKTNASFIFDTSDSDSERIKSRTPSPLLDYDSEIDRLAKLSLENDAYPVEAPRCFPTKDYGSEYYRNDEIPTEVVDTINNVPEWQKMRNGRAMVSIFETMIQANTAEDEPHAPPIHVINDIDDEPTPPFEFYYTNKLYHSEGVPAPEYKTLQGCNCIGRCNPHSTTCSCLRRQKTAFGDSVVGDACFAYEDGLLQYDGFPVFECNDACGCTEDCPNRVSGLFGGPFLPAQECGRFLAAVVPFRLISERQGTRDGVRVSSLFNR